jgi:ubiquitin-protein ligase
MENRMSKRLQRELESIKKNFEDLVEVCLVNDDIKCWHLKIEGPAGSIYAKEQYTYTMFI